MIGAGIFGATAATVLAEAGNDVALVESGSEPLRGASLHNQRRIHLGYHYPRSAEMAAESAAGLRSFRGYYEGCIRDDTTSWYAVSRGGSHVTASEFEKFCANNGLEIRAGTPPAGWLVRDGIEAAWRTPEQTFDYERLRTLITARLARARVRTLLRTEIVAADYGPPWHIELSTGVEIGADLVVNATYSSLNEVGRFFCVEPREFLYQFCVMPVLDAARQPLRTGVTVMDGPFCSMIPDGRTVILSHVTDGVAFSEVAHQRPAFDDRASVAAAGDRTLQACREYFPIARRMECVGVLATWKASVPCPATDAKPSLVWSDPRNVFTILAGKVTSCVEIARRLAHAAREVAGAVPS